MDDGQLLRYSRHIMLSEFDIEGQQRLLDSRVLLVGLGGLGCPVAMYLAASGVGDLVLADNDEIDLSNLQRQIAHTTIDIGKSKVESAKQSVLALNPDINITSITERLSGPLLTEQVRAADVVVDASDNFSTRFAINRACVEHGVPLVSGAAIRSEGQLVVFDSRDHNSPCYRCLYDDNVNDDDLSCSESGVLAPLVGVIGSMQALETVKLLAGYGHPLLGKLFIFDAYTMLMRTLTVKRAADCPVCGQ
jgi:molybdopterin-synthase adenylyltransferase